MAFIGNQPTAVPLTSSQLADGLITTDKLAANAVTSAKILDSTIVNSDISASAAIAQTKISGSFGKVLQVIGATDSTSRSTTSTSFVTASNTLSVSITPSSASNKIAIFVNHYSYNDTSTSFYTIYRDATNLGNTDGFATWNSRGGNQSGITSYNYLDSPATTSAITYQVYMKTSAGTGYMCEASIKSQIICMEIAG